MPAQAKYGPGRFGLRNKSNNNYLNDVKPYEAPEDDILSNGVSVINNTTSTVIITVPAGRTWFGELNLCAVSTSSTSSLQNAKIVVQGSDAVPVAGTTLLTLFSQSQASGGLVTDASDVYIVAPAGNSVTLELVNSTATTFASTASAIGILL